MKAISTEFFSVNGFMVDLFTYPKHYLAEVYAFNPNKERVLIKRFKNAYDKEELVANVMSYCYNLEICPHCQGLGVRSKG